MQPVVYVQQETPKKASGFGVALAVVGGLILASIIINVINGYIKASERKKSSVSTADSSIVTTTTTAEKEQNLKIGETWTVDGQWKLTITNVRKTEDRNIFEHDKDPKAVYYIDYVYENIGYEDQDFLVYLAGDTVVDSEGYTGYSYPLNDGKEPTYTPIGAKCEATGCIGIDHDGGFKLHISIYDDNFRSHDIIFEYEP